MVHNSEHVRKSEHVPSLKLGTPFSSFFGSFDPTQTTLTPWHFHTTHPILTKLWNSAKKTSKNRLVVVTSPGNNSFIEFRQEKHTSQGIRFSKPPELWSEGIKQSGYEISPVIEFRNSIPVKNCSNCRKNWSYYGS